MPLIICGDCQKKYSDYASACPECGRPTITQKHINNLFPNYSSTEDKLILQKNTQSKAKKTPKVEKTPELEKTLEVEETSEPLSSSSLFNSIEPYQLNYRAPSFIEAEINLQVKDLLEIILSPKKIDTETEITSYFEAISKIRHLQYDEARDLTKQCADLIQVEKLASQYESEKGHFPSDKEWAELIDMPVIKFKNRLNVARRAREIIVQHNLRLVVSIVKKYKYMNSGLSFPELIQIGGSGLISAAENYDVRDGFQFTTYAREWIRQAIKRTIENKSFPYSSQKIKLRTEEEKAEAIKFEKFLKKIKTLSTKERNVLLMKYRTDEQGAIKSTKQISRFLGISENTIRQIINRAFIKIQKHPKVED